MVSCKCGQLLLRGDTAIKIGLPAEIQLVVSHLLAMTEADAECMMGSHCQFDHAMDSDKPDCRYWVNDGANHG